MNKLMIKILTTRKLLEKQKTKILGYQKGLLQIEKRIYLT